MNITTPLLVTAELPAEFALRKHERLGALCLHTPLPDFPEQQQRLLSPTHDPQEAGLNLLPLLLELDDLGLRLILVELPPVSEPYHDLREAMLSLSDEQHAARRKRPGIPQSEPELLRRIWQAPDEATLLDIVRQLLVEGVSDLELQLHLYLSSKSFLPRYDQGAGLRMEEMGYLGPFCLGISDDRHIAALLHPGRTEMEDIAWCNHGFELCKLLFDDEYPSWQEYDTYFAPECFSEQVWFRVEALERLLPEVERSIPYVLESNALYCMLRRSAEDIVLHNIFKYESEAYVDMPDRLAELQKQVLRLFIAVLREKEPDLPFLLELELLCIGDGLESVPDLVGQVVASGMQLSGRPFQLVTRALLPDPRNLPFLLGQIQGAVQARWDLLQSLRQPVAWHQAEGPVFQLLEAAVPDGAERNFARLARAYMDAEDRSVYFRAYCSSFYPEETIALLLEVLERLPPSVGLDSSYVRHLRLGHVVPFFRDHVVLVKPLDEWSKSYFSEGYRFHLEVLVQLPFERRHCEYVMGNLSKYRKDGSYGNEDLIGRLEKRCGRLMED